jgi:hypothetical protein
MRVTANHLRLLSSRTARSKTLVPEVDQGPRHTGASQVPIKKSVKKVSFDLLQNKQYTNKQRHNDQQVCDTWYSAHDFNEFRRRTAMAIQALFKSHKTRVLYETIIKQTYAACCQALKETDQVLTLYESDRLIYCMDVKLLGLEKYVVKAVAAHRSKRRAVIRRAVMFVHADTDGNCDIIRAKSESISLTSRLYARSVGVALAHAQVRL